MTGLSPLPDWIAPEYPFRPRTFVTPAGARMSYLDEGGAGDEAVLMLHGNPTWSYYYRHLVRAVSPSLRCIVPDHIGMGASEKPADYAYTLATRIADVEALVASLGLKRVHLVVHDWGGAIGFGFAARHPALIGRIVILNTAAFAVNRIPARIALCKLPGIGPLLVRGLNGFAGPAVWMAMHRRALSADEKRGYLWPYRSWADRVAVSAFVRDIPMQPSHPSWNTLAAVERGFAHFRDRPALVFWGGRDFCFNDLFLGRWREILPQARVNRIAGAGHYVLDDARDEVIPPVTAFLQPA
ncbi:MAG: alpha/beta fold hydrolase [Gemmatimonadaceae bacterium]|nr:alpha/beta fold hydrolase [Gemmatimonadaceae bacterium]